MTKYITISILTITLWACNGGNKDTGFSEETEQPTSKPVAVGKVDESDTIQVTALGANMSEIRYDTKVIRVPANKHITVALTNKSTDATMPHNLVFIYEGKANDVGQGGLHYKDNAYVNPEDKNVIAHSPLAQINETVYFSLTTPEAGDYEFICSYPGHWGMMKGKFITE